MHRGGSKYLINMWTSYVNVASLAACESAVLRDEAGQVEQLLLGERAPEELLLRVHLQQRLVTHLLSLNLKK